MKTYVKIYSSSLLACLIFLVFSCSRQDTIPVTTSSEEALNFYNQAIVAMEKVYMDKSYDLLDQALEEDPDFFRANYMKALNSFYFKEMEEFEEFGRKALDSKAKLSRGEELMKEALEKLLENNEADVTELGKELVRLYPNDKMAYYQLASFQTIINDNEGIIKTYTDVLEVTDNPAPVYNVLGYTYMTLDKMQEAEKSFDKYIELAPDQPNPYDSKGDYFMRLGEYEQAYEQYMKAFEIDTDFQMSYNKAMNIKSKMDTLVSIE